MFKFVSFKYPYSKKNKKLKKINQIFNMQYLTILLETDETVQSIAKI